MKLKRHVRDPIRLSQRVIILSLVNIVVVSTYTNLGDNLNTYFVSLKQRNIIIQFYYPSYVIIIILILNC